MDGEKLRNGVFAPNTALRSGRRVYGKATIEMLQG
jgi:hypothetical protein